MLTNNSKLDLLREDTFKEMDKRKRIGNRAYLPCRCFRTILVDDKSLHHKRTLCHLNEVVSSRLQNSFWPLSNSDTLSNAIHSSDQISLDTSSKLRLKVQRLHTSSHKQHMRQRCRNKQDIMKLVNTPKHNFHHLPCQWSNSSTTLSPNLSISLKKRNHRSQRPMLNLSLERPSSYDQMPILCRLPRHARQLLLQYIPRI